MYTIDELHFAHICGSDITFRVSPNVMPEAKSTPLYRVDLAIRNTLSEVQGSEFHAGLLGPDMQELRRATKIFDCIVLPGIEIGGSKDVFRSDHFELLNEEPRFLIIWLRGHKEVFELIQRADTNGIQDPNDGPEDQPVEPELPDEGQDGELIALATACCPITFQTPTGNQPTVFRKLYNANGALNRHNAYCRTWVINATFNDAPARVCECTLCEYRQRVKGKMEATVPTVGKMDVSPITDYQLPAGPGARPRPVNGLNPRGFVEDTKGVPARPSQPVRYGRRNDLNGAPGVPPYRQGYPTDCSYFASDEPSVTGNPPPGTKIDVDVTFQGTIVDTSTNAIKSGPKTWTWKVRKTF
jgi:hypothetical protein